ncbi:MAG: alpha/beta hydrolase, partial [Proteiniphilum sp.]|nr:alpha/beta hydrolase [Proteiniphilum sp.]
MKNITVLIIALAMSATAISTVNAQYYQKAEQNPFTLVYEGAITENIKGKVNIHPVTYKIKDINV